jgi:hypothetical protein
MRCRAVVVLAGLAVAVAGALPAPPADAAPVGKRAKPLRLATFSSCRSLVQFARVNALRTAGAPGVAPRPFTSMPIEGPAADVESGRPVAAPAPSAPAQSGPAPDHSSTTTQEEGVDEPDVVKTDGQHLFAIAGSSLHAVEVRGDPPKLVGTLELGEGGDHQVLLHGGRLLVISQSYQTPPLPPPMPGASIALPVGQPITVLTEVDARNPAAMRVVRTVRAEGSYTSARLNGATARVVLSSPPELGATTPEAIRAARLATWLPGGLVTNKRTGRKSGRHLVACSAVRRPRSFSGLGMLTVLTIDMDKGLPWVDSDAVMTDAQTVYGSPSSLYVATQRWIDAATPPDQLPTSVTTQIHKFDATDSQSTTYGATGEVRGHLLNQFSLSEHNGLLRVASTDTPVWVGGQEMRQSESVVTVLEQTGSRLVSIGSVGGLGRGERIYSVRFLGDAGYVVTFRQVDPLYTIDLSKPTQPRVAGELKVRGYSAYLHPLDAGLLLGVGQDATGQGQVTGAQLSLFDVSDLANPRRLSQRAIAPSATSEAEYDHHAFLYWAPTKLAMLPVQTYDGVVFAGAIGFRVDRDTGIAEVGRVEHPGGGAPAVRRSIVVGDRVFTLSERGVLASGLSDLAPKGWIGF